MIEAGSSVSIIGRLASLPVHRAFRVLERLGAVPRRRLTPRTGMVVVGQGAATLLRGDRRGWIELVDRAWRLGADLLSETDLLRRLRLLPPPAEAGTMELARAAQLAGLDDEMLQALVLFDVLVPHRGRLEFRDVVLAREVGRLLGEGASLFTLVSELAPARRRAVLGRSADFAGQRLVLRADGRIAVRVGEGLATPGGQFELGLAELPLPTADDLYGLAERAEDEQDFALAERMYRLAAQMDPSDAVAHFNLANALVGLARDAEAKVMYRRAAEIDPGMADAWYNLGFRLAGEGRRHEAAQAFQRAIEAEPEYAAAYFNLATLHYELGSPGNARLLLRKYLELEPSAEPWASRARRLLDLVSVFEVG